MHGKELETVCGLDCGDCAYMKEGCRGCNVEKGMPFWCGFAGVGICPVYACCVNERRLVHCGLYDQMPWMPCPKFTEIRDPNLTDEQVEECLRARAAELMRRANAR